MWLWALGWVLLVVQMGDGTVLAFLVRVSNFQRWVRLGRGLDARLDLMDWKPHVLMFFVDLESCLPPLCFFLSSSFGFELGLLLIWGLRSVGALEMVNDLISANSALTNGKNCEVCWSGVGFFQYGGGTTCVHSIQKEKGTNLRVTCETQVKKRSYIIEISMQVEILSSHQRLTSR